MKRGRRFSVAAGSFLLIIGTYLVLHSQIVFDLEHFPIRDSFSYHFQSFWIWANSFNFYLLPNNWFIEWGGWPALIGLPSLNYLLPNKLIGYFLYSITDWPPVLIYKLSLALGVCLVAFTTMVASRQAKLSILACGFAAVTVLTSGISFTPFHQDQILGTLFWYPVLALALLVVKDDSRWRGLPLVVIALMLSAHYPLIHLMFLAFGFLLLIVRRQWKIFLNFRPTWLTLLLSVFALYPFIYIFVHIHQITSPVRDGIVFAQNYRQYVELNLQQRSSATWGYLMNLIVPGQTSTFSSLPLAGQDDMMLFFIPRFALLLAVWGAWVGRKRFGVLLSLTLFAAWGAIGIHGGLAQLVYFSQLPGSNNFRQWYHFSSIFILGLCFFAALGFENIFARIHRPRAKILFSIVVFAACLIDGKIQSQFYSERFGPNYPSQWRQRVTVEEFGNLFAHMDHMNLFAFPNAYSFLKKCPEWRIREAVATDSLPVATQEGDCPPLPKNQKRFNFLLKPNGSDLNFETFPGRYLIFPIALPLIRAVKIDGETVSPNSFNGLTMLEIPTAATNLKLRVNRVSQSLGWIAYLAAMAGVCIGLCLSPWGTRSIRGNPT